MKNYKTAKDYSKGDMVILWGSQYIIEEIYKGMIEITLFDGNKKKVFIPDTQSLVTIKNKKGQKRKIAYNKFAKIIDEENLKKDTYEV